MKVKTWIFVFGAWALGSIILTSPSFSQASPKTPELSMDSLYYSQVDTTDEAWEARDIVEAFFNANPGYTRQIFGVDTVEVNPEDTQSKFFRLGFYDQKKEEYHLLGRLLVFKGYVSTPFDPQEKGHNLIIVIRLINRGDKWVLDDSPPLSVIHEEE